MTAPNSAPRPQSDSARILKKVWRGMPPADRAAAVRAATRGGNPGAANGLRMAVIKAMRMRPGTVQGWSPQQLADASAKIPLGDDLIAELLVGFHLAERVALLSAFLDAAGVAHTDGVTEDTSASEGLPPERVLAAADTVLANFPPEACQVYFATLIALEGGGWEPLRARVDESLLG